MRIRILPVLCVFVVFQGCGTLRKTEEPLAWSKGDRKFAKSLAHFAQGLIYENALGDGSEQALNEFIAAYESNIIVSENEILPRIATYYLNYGTNTVTDKIQERQLIDFYAEATANKSTNPSDYYTLARLFFRNHEDSRALETIKQGLKNAKPQHLLRTYCYLQGKEFVAKQEFLRAAVCFEMVADETTPDYARFHFIIAELYQLLNQHDKAIENFRMATEGPAPFSEAFIKYSFYYFSTDPSKAVDILKKGAEKLPSDPKIIFYLGYIYCIQHKLDEAISMYDKIPDLVKCASDAKLTPEFYLAYGSACEQAGRHKKAEQIFKDGLSQYPDDPEILNYLAYMYASNGTNLDEAIELINQALKAEPENGAYIDTLGWILYKQNKYEDAITQIEKAYLLIPDDATIQDHMGDVHMKLNDTYHAIEFWKNSFLLDTSNESVQNKLKAHNINLKKLKRMPKPASINKEYKTDSGK